MANHQILNKLKIGGTAHGADSFGKRKLDKSQQRTVYMA